MAARWSSEFTVTEHKDLQASAMAVDWTGVFVMLAGRRYLAIKNLDDALDNLYKVSRHSKYEVGAAEWNPSASHKELCAISSNQRVEILSWDCNGSLEQTHTMRSHTRVVSDVNWHRFDPNLLASCSIDTFIHVWDIRDQRRPTLSLSAVVGGTQVRWNRLSPYLLATAHDGDIKLWDQRKGTAPVQYIAAHLSKIHGLDWSPSLENQLATSSQDCTVKFFDVTNPRRAEIILTTPAPVWRARYTPFGEGLITVVVPQLRRGENSLLLWNISNQTAPVHTFVGHTDVVLEFQWRQHTKCSSDYQLVTWSKDQSLRIWRIEPFLQKLCGHDDDAEDQALMGQQHLDHVARTNLGVESALSHTLQSLVLGNGGGLQDSLSVEEEAPGEVTPSPTQPKTLQQEFSLVNINQLNLQVDAMDVSRRSCTVTVTRNSHVVVLLVNFPSTYPYNTAPLFQFGPGSTVDSMVMAKLLKVLQQTAQQRVRKSKSCLEPCLRQLVLTLEQLTLSEEADSKPFLRLHSQPNPYLESPNMYGSFQDAYIPFPRTSGAKFCSVGLLVCFGRPPFARRMSTRLENPTPRSLSALGGSSAQFSLMYPPPTQGSLGDPNLSITAYYFQDRQQAGRSRGRHGSGRGLQGLKNTTKKLSLALVTVYDASSLFFIHRELAEKYALDQDDLPAMCQRNAAVAAQLGRRDLMQTWTLAAQAATAACSTDADSDTPWPHHPFGRALIESLISHYAKQSDIQTAAMLCCTFGCRTENQSSYKLRQLSKSVNVSRLATGKWWLKPGGSPYHTIHQVDMSLEGCHYPMLKQNRSNSWSDSLDDFKFSSTIVEHRELGDVEDRTSRMKLDDGNTVLYDSYKRAYSEILHRWYLLDSRAKVLKYMSTAPEPHRGVEFSTECRQCNKSVRGPSCPFCKHIALQCIICHVSVRGSANFCLMCGHGGHTAHMQAWFEHETVCPSGCGCSCLAETASILEP